MADNAASNDDRARRLAERIGALRAAGRALEEADWPDDDTVIRVLRAYRAGQDPSPAPEQSARMWAAIDAETADAEAPAQEAEAAPARIFALPSAVRWAVAASLLLAVGVTWLLLSGPPAPEPVAAATTAVATYTAPDGSTIRLRPHSTLYRIAATDARRYRLEGEAFFDVATRAEPFIVDAGALQVRVLGTRFTAHTWGQPAVFLQEGRVRVRTTARSDTVTLAPGQQSMLAADGTLTPPAPADTLAALDWLRDEIALDGQPAGAVVAELAHHYDLTITLPDPVAAETLSGRIALETPQQSLSDLGVVLGGRFERVDARTYRFTPSEDAAQ